MEVRASMYKALVFIKKKEKIGSYEVGKEISAQYAYVKYIKNGEFEVVTTIQNCNYFEAKALIFRNQLTPAGYIPPYVSLDEGIPNNVYLV